MRPSHRLHGGGSPLNKDGHVVNAALLAVGIGFILEPAGDIPTFVKIIEVGPPIILGALFPDVDTAFGKHRKTLHNLPLLAAAIAFPLYFGNLQYVWIGSLTHYILDIVGSKRGIALCYPYSQEYGFPTGVATSSTYTIHVTVVITVIELALVAGFVFYAVPEFGITGLDGIANVFGF